MKIETNGKHLRIFIHSTDRWHAQPLYAAIVQLCRQQGVAGVTVTRGIEGCGDAGHVLEMASKAPMLVEIVDIAERIEPLQAALEPMIGQGLLSVSDVHILRYLPESQAVVRPAPAMVLKRPGAR